MGRGSGGGGGGGSGGRSGGGGTDIEFTGGYDTIYGKTPDMRRRETLLTLPRRLSGDGRTTGEDFMVRTRNRLKKARNEDAVSGILQRAQNYLGKLEQAQVFPGTSAGKAPW